jgi:hypothetical protein
LRNAAMFGRLAVCTVNCLKLSTVSRSNGLTGKCRDILISQALAALVFQSLAVLVSSALELRSARRFNGVPLERHAAKVPKRFGRS